MTAAASPRLASNKWLVLVLVCIAQFMVVLDATVVNVALPSIQDDLGFSGSSLQWVVNAYTLAFGGFLLLGGRAADFVGRKRLFIAGVIVFTVASALAGLATSSEFLIVARALQGLGGAMVSPAALSIVTTTFKDGAGADQGAQRLGGDRRRRRGRGPAARRDPHRVPVLGVDLLRQRAGRRSRRCCCRCASSPSRGSRPPAWTCSARSASPPASRCWSTRS